jgi:hypothetical protein
VCRFSLNANIETKLNEEILQKDSSRMLQVFGRGPIRLDLPYWLESQEWNIFGKIEQIIKARKNRIKTFEDAVPWQVSMFSGYAIFFSALAAFYFVSLRSGYFKPLIFLFAVLEVLWASFTAITIYAVWRNNFVFLRYSRQDQRQREILRNERWEKIALVLLGAVLGAILGPVGQFLFAKWKH